MECLVIILDIDLPKNKCQCGVDRSQRNKNILLTQKMFTCTPLLTSLSAEHCGEGVHTSRGLRCPSQPSQPSQQRSISAMGRKACRFILGCGRLSLAGEPLLVKPLLHHTIDLPGPGSDLTKPETL